MLALKFYFVIIRIEGFMYRTIHTLPYSAPTSYGTCSSVQYIIPHMHAIFLVLVKESGPVVKTETNKVKRDLMSKVSK